MMGMMKPETCWDTNKYIIFSASGWFLFTFMIQDVRSHEIKISVNLLQVLKSDQYSMKHVVKLFTGS
jgi:hypothetical protein